MYSVGIDSGTQGTKVIIIDFDGKVYGRAGAAHEMSNGLKSGESEQHPDMWVSALKKSLGEALADSGIEAKEIACLGISGQQHGFVPLDSSGRPIRPAKLWNDTSTIEETRELLEALGGKTGYIDTLGINLAVGFTASKILWLKKNEPQHFARMSSVLLPHNYLNYFLTGTVHMEYGDASGTGLMDIRNRTWEPGVLKLIDPGLPGKLPPLSHPGEPVGLIKKEIADLFGMEKVLVAAGGGDNMMGAIGSGNVRPGICTLSLGTSGTIYAYSDRPVVDPQGEIAAFCDSTGGWLPLLCTMNVTNTTELLKKVLDCGNTDLEDSAGQAPPGSGSLIFLPFLDGERVPALPESSGVFFGLNRRNFSRPHLTRAVMEGTILNLGYGFSRMKSLGLEPKEIRATGGGAKSGTWLQITADILGTPVITLEEDEAAALGAAVQAIWCHHNHKGHRIPLSEITDSMIKTAGRTYLPDGGNAGIYAALQDRFNSLWETLSDEFRRHRNVMKSR